jgi:cytochrome c oxidase subunit 2
MKIRLILTLVAIAIVLVAISLWMGQQSYSWFPPQASAESIQIDNLFSFLVSIGTFIFLGVAGTVMYSMLFQRAAKYDDSDGPHIEGNVTLEVVWTAIPICLVIWIAGYSYQIYDRMSILGPMEHVHMGIAAVEAAPIGSASDGASTSAAEPKERIEVLARQWAWEFRYPDRNVTSTELHLPVNRRIELALNSEDVLHGFFVPAFRVKQDVVPGRAIDFEFTPIREGTYRLRDSQYSGTYFAAMQTNVVVESPESYQQWLANAASRTPTTAYNQAFTEYRRLQESGTAGWKTVIPAPPPVVNYANSQESAS